jgi:hypothetical protein
VSLVLPSTSQLPIENITIGGFEAMPLKKENGAKFHLASPSSELSVSTQAIGRGIMV